MEMWIMKRHALAFAVLLCLLSCALASPAAAAKDTWTSVRSKNFFLVGNASERDIKQVATRLEQFRDVFTRLLPKANFNSTVPTTVIVFKSDSSYKPFKPLYQGKPANVAGYFQPGQDVNYITLATERSDENPYDVIFHEYVHLLVDNTLANTPLWFNEGLAEYYSTFEVTDGDKKAWVGKPKGYSIQLLREQKMMPLKTLFAVDHNSPLYNEGNKQSIFYAESWALVHYLLLGNNGQRLPQLNKFLDLLGGGTSVEDAFKQAFQTDFAVLEKELKQYVQRDSYPAKTATFERKLEFDSEMQSAPLTEAEAQGYLGDLLLHINRLDDAEAKLQQALTLDPKLSMAQSSLGIVRMRQRRYGDAREALRKAIESNSQNYLAHYYYAFVLSRGGMDENQMVMRYEPQDVETMRASLKKAIELKPDFAESYHLLAFVNMVANERLDESIDLLRRALTLSPGNQIYTFSLAEVYMQKRDYDTARRLLTPIARSSGSDAGLRANAESMLRALANIQEQQARYNSGGGDRGEAAEPPAPKRNETVDAAANGPTQNKAPASYDPSAVLRESLRQPSGSEKRVQGTLVKIDCDARGIVFTVRVGASLFKLHTAKFEEVDITTYTTDVGGDIACGPRKQENPVVITFRPSPARRGWDGEAVAIEFVPKEFVLEAK
jgi:tetratricopeptide (TPR) repeat protein